MFNYHGHKNFLTLKSKCCAVCSVAHFSKFSGSHTSVYFKKYDRMLLWTRPEYERPFRACVRNCECLTDLNDLLGVQPEVKVTEDEIRQSLEPLIRDPAERSRHTQSQTWSVQQPHLVDECAWVSDRWLTADQQWCHTESLMETFLGRTARVPLRSLLNPTGRFMKCRTREVSATSLWPLKKMHLKRGIINSP